MNFLQISLNELIQGFRIDGTDVYCNYCLNFTTNASDSLSTSIAKVTQHIEDAHHGPEQALLTFESKYNTLTDKQKELLLQFTLDKKDQEIADDLQVSPSTIRHQKFTFREKAKQAKVYLAQFEAVFSNTHESEDTLLPTPDQSEIIDDRFLITEKEYADIVKKYFDFSQGTVVLKTLPKGQKKIIAILNRIIEEFSMNHHYSGQEIDMRLKEIYFDYLLIKRYLVDYGFFTRIADGSDYSRIY